MKINCYSFMMLIYKINIILCYHIVTPANWFFLFLFFLYFIKYTIESIELYNLFKKEEKREKGERMGNNGYRNRYKQISIKYI
jgi:hypothetical protein